MFVATPWSTEEEEIILRYCSCKFVDDDEDKENLSANTIWNWLLFLFSTLTTSTTQDTTLAACRRVLRYHLPDSVVAFAKTTPLERPWPTKAEFLQATPYEQIARVGFSIAKFVHDFTSKQDKKSKSTFAFPYARDKGVCMIPEEEEEYQLPDLKTTWPFPHSDYLALGWVCEAIPGKLYYGPAPHAIAHEAMTADLSEFLSSAIVSFGVTDCISLLEDFDEQNYDTVLDHVTKHSFPLPDDSDMLKTLLAKTIDAVFVVFNQPGRTVYLHCALGYHRSASIVHGLLIRHMHLTLAQARRHLFFRRPSSRIFSHFELFQRWDGASKHVDRVFETNYFDRKRHAEVTYFDHYELLLHAIPELAAYCPFGSWAYDAGFFVTRTLSFSKKIDVDLIQSLWILYRDAEDCKHQNQAAFLETFQDYCSRHMNFSHPPTRGEEQRPPPHQKILERIVRLWPQIDCL